MERDHFHFCMSVKVHVNTTMIAAGRKEGTAKHLYISTASRFWVMLGNLLPIISIF